MSERVDSTWVRFGHELRRLRLLSGRTQGDLGRSVGLSKPMISALERGTRTPKGDTAAALDSALSTGGVLDRLWRELSDTREVPHWFRDALLIERKAREIREYVPLIVPGLLQTADYARSLIRAWRVRDTPEEVEQIVRARIERLPAISDSHPLLRFVVREAAISRVVGSREIMLEQLKHIGGLIEEGTVRLQVLRDSPEVPAGLPFRVSILSDTQAVGYVEHALGGETYDTPGHVAELTSVYGELQAEALSSGESLSLIRRAQGEL
ncbi:helix-turn-helix domain-containing protein [Nocardiopsis trehalosi]|jgi:transcriptional regulator with XRE-family HTH domain|uniref:helix-turn-helix domain-containing protein n=1 Tax=Nocardiopsis trehalosi TaxID=109329 RepID=UPI0009FDE0B9|nr:helix-turn-helix transcriptional regulator [Nocardiopsis trehalosi]